MLRAVSEWLLTLKPTPTIWVGLSGGKDSVALLHCLAQYRQQYHIQAVHVHHGLSPNADQWQALCESMCHQLQIPLSVHRTTILSDRKNSLEMAARTARYSLFAEKMAQGDILVTAHHQQDQAETLLLNLARGTGLMGLAAMPTIKPFAKGAHARPMLGVSSQAIDAYITEHTLAYCEDESNSNTDFRRNFIRHEVLPVLGRAYPSIVQQIYQTAELCGDAQALLDQYLHQDYLSLLEGQALNLGKWRQLPKLKQIPLLRYTLRQMGLTPPSMKRIQDIAAQLLVERLDTQIDIPMGSMSLKTYQGRLYGVCSDHPNWRLVKVQGRGFKASEQNIELKVRQGGEQIPMHGGWHKSVKKWLQECAVPPWERQLLPLVYVHGKLIGVGNHIAHSEYKVVDSVEWGWEVCWA